MALNHVPIDTTKRLGGQLRRLVDVTREVVAGFDAHKAIMDEMNGADFTAIETQYGIPAGKGQIIYNMVTSARTTVKGTATNQFIDRLG